MLIEVEKREKVDKYAQYKALFRELPMLDTMELPLGALSTQGEDDGRSSYSHGIIRAKWSEEEQTIWVVDGNHRVWEMRRDPEKLKGVPSIEVMKVPFFDWQIEEE